MKVGEIWFRIDGVTMDHAYDLPFIDNQAQIVTMAQRVRITRLWRHLPSNSDVVECEGLDGHANNCGREYFLKIYRKEE